MAKYKIKANSYSSLIELVGAESNKDLVTESIKSIGLFIMQKVFSKKCSEANRIFRAGSIS